MIKKIMIMLMLIILGLGTTALADSLGEAPESSSLEYRDTLDIKESESGVETPANQELIYGENIGLLPFRPNPEGEMNYGVGEILDEFITAPDANPGCRGGCPEPEPEKGRESVLGGGAAN